MAESTEVARLLLEAQARGFPEARKQIADLDAQLALIKHQYETGAIDIDAYLEAGGRLQGSIDTLKSSLQTAEGALKKYGDAQKASAALASQAQSRLGGFQQAITAAGYALQDAASAGGGFQQKLSAISNNIPAIVAGLGVGGPWGLAIGSAISALAALGANWETIWRYFQEKNPFPKGAQDIDGMRHELERARDEMKKLEENASLTAREMARYNDLRKTTADLEEKVAAAAERQQAIKRALEEVTPEQEERARTFQEQTKGRFRENYEALFADALAEAQKVAQEESRITGKAVAVDAQQVAKQVTTYLLQAQKGEREGLEAIQHFVRTGGEAARVIGPQLARPTERQARETEQFLAASADAEERALKQQHDDAERARKAREDAAKETARLAQGKFTGPEEMAFQQFQMEQLGEEPILPPRGQPRAVDEGALEAARMRQEERERRGEEREARAAPREEREALAGQFAGAAAAQGFNPQAAAEIGRRAAATFERTGDMESAFNEAIFSFQRVIAGMQAHQQRMQAGLARVVAGNRALQARQRTAQAWPGG